MQIQEYVARYDGLAEEDHLFQIPLRKEYLLSQIGKGKKVLDVGCLGGKLSKLIMDQPNEVWAIELNHAAAQAARMKGIHVIEANVENGFPFDSESFDFIHAGELIERLYDTTLFFSECRRVLRKNGRILLTSPNINSLENRIRVLLGKYPSRVGAYPEDHYGDHVRFFNVDKIRELCAQTHLEVEQVRGIPALHSLGYLGDLSLQALGRVFPEFSALLMVSISRS